MSRRLTGLIKKEFIQIIRDPSSLAVAFFLPVLLLVLFGYGVSLDAEHVPIGVVIDKQDRITNSFVSMFQGSIYFNVTIFRNYKDAEDQIKRHKIDGIIHIKDDFSSKILSGSNASAQLVVNAADANNARMVMGYAEAISSNWLEKFQKEQGIDFKIPVKTEYRIWFNPEVRSRNFLVPGLIVVIMTLIGALLTALVMAREYERGTMESLIVTPVTVTEILLGKLISYFILGMGGMLISVLMAVFLFDVPLRGSIWVLTLTSSLFLIVALGMGLAISSLAKEQFVAGQAAIVVTFLPAFLLSGFIFEVGNMPKPLQIMTNLIAARHFVSILQTVFLAGDLWVIILPKCLILIVMATFFLMRTKQLTKKRL